MKKLISLFIVLLMSMHIMAQQSAPDNGTDANIIGHVTCNGEHLPFVNIQLKGTTLGTLTDETGHFQMVNLPLGKQIILFSFVGYKPTEREVILEKGNTIEIKINLEEDVLGLEEVVVTGSRSTTSRSESPVVVQTLDARILESTQSQTIGDGLNFSTGVRTENNCSNCGFSQVRMNGLEGPYSQILINSRPIFSGLAGVYGLEMIPKNMIEKIEVVRGGGSALYGSNAIAGTINLILKDPFTNTYEVGYNTSLIGLGYDDRAVDHNVNFNTTIVSKNYRTGLSLFGYNRDRSAWDSNNDGYSEMVQIENTTFGARFNQHLGDRSKISVDFFKINEERRGGNAFDKLLHEADIAEAVGHKITSGALTFERHMRKNDLLSVFASGQQVKRNSYYGAEQSLSDYGYTQDLTTSVGAQYKTSFNNSKIVSGIEYTFNHLQDTKLGYREIDSLGNVNHIANTTIANQHSSTLGAFSQYELKWRRFTFSLGARYDRYLITDLEDIVENKAGDVISPRLNVMYDIMNNLKVRGSYSNGYRAPQIFDEDLHIETSGSRKVIYRNDPNLVAERSTSMMLSFEFTEQVKESYFSVLLEGFYTKLENPFANVVGEMDDNGLVVYTRTNAASGAIIQGINTEISIYPSSDLMISMGGTVQSSKYQEVHDFGEKAFFRTPNSYGFVALDYDFYNDWCVSVSGNYTGKMLVPYYGITLADPEAGELKETQDFFDLGAKLSYTRKLGKTQIEVLGGIKNIFNAYQQDHDLGIEKDPAYIYGPAQPRTIYVGFRLGNFL
jgi:outer membrane receptor for ferrienterochelin and colicins